MVNYLLIMDPLSREPHSLIRFFSRLVELSIAPEMNAQLIPPHARPALEARGLGLDTFKPLAKEEMIAHLD
jgi:hypothetical protein